MILAALYEQNSMAKTWMGEFVRSPFLVNFCVAAKDGVFLISILISPMNFSRFFPLWYDTGGELRLQ